jgi:hypothetical protein
MMNAILERFYDKRPIMQNALLRNPKYALYYNLLDQNYANNTGVILTASALRLEQQYTGQTTINFPVGVSQAQTNSEIRLNNNNNFHIDSFMFGIMRRQTSQAPNYTGDIINFYPNPLQFSASGEAAGLEVLYKGFLSATVNNQLIMNNFSTSVFRAASISQALTANTVTGAGVTAPTNAIQTNSSTNHEMIVPIEPSITMPGASVPTITLNLPFQQTITPAEGYQDWVVLIPIGFLAQNVGV